MLEHQPAFLNLSFSICVPWYSSKQVSEEAGIGSLEAQEMLLLSAMLPQYPELHLMVTAGKAALTFASQTGSALFVCLRASTNILFVAS